MLVDQKKPSSLGIEMPVMGGVNLPCTEIPTFDGNILTWRPFCDQFQAAVHDKPNLGDTDKLPYLWDALKVGAEMHVI